jgi:glycosyltransferase involved in cell wall biosynthesis
MRFGLVIYGSLDTLSGGYLYDRKLVEYLRSQRDTVEIFSLPWRNYAAHLTDNFHFRLPFSSVIAGEATLAPGVHSLAPPARASVPRVWSPTMPGSADEQSLTDSKLDLLIQDELNHPSLVAANAGKHPYPIISLVHHLRCSELRPTWQNAIYRMVEKKYLRSVDGFIFNSRTTKSAVIGLIGKAKPSIIAYPPTDRFGEAISEEEIISRAKTNPLRILFLGNVMERKGLHTLLEAINFQLSAIKLNIVGSLNSEPVYAKQMRDYVTTNNLSSSVSFHGLLDNHPLIEKLKQAHVLVVPSSYEGYGIAYLEGMCFGLPAIGTTAGAAGEIITEGINGFLIEPGDADLLADRLQLLNQKREVLIRMSLAARARYLQQPKWEETAGKIRAFLQSVLETTG